MPTAPSRGTRKPSTQLKCHATSEQRLYDEAQQYKKPEGDARDIASKKIINASSARLRQEVIEHVPSGVPDVGSLIKAATRGTSIGVDPQGRSAFYSVSIQPVGGNKTEGTVSNVRTRTVVSRTVDSQAVELGPGTRRANPGISKNKLASAIYEEVLADAGRTLYHEALHAALIFARGGVKDAKGNLVGEGVLHSFNAFSDRLDEYKKSTATAGFGRTPSLGDAFNRLTQGTTQVQLGILTDEIFAHSTALRARPDGDVFKTEVLAKKLADQVGIDKNDDETRAALEEVVEGVFKAELREERYAQRLQVQDELMRRARQ